MQRLFLFWQKERETMHYNNLSQGMVRKIRRYEPVEAEGLTLYPIRVREFEEFSIVRPVIDFMQQCLPVTLISKPILQAFYRMELDAAEHGEKSEGMIFKCVLALLLALRIGDGMEMEQRMQLVQIVPNADDPKRLERIVFRTEDGEKSVTPAQFQRIRPILAAQNGIEMVSENANPELVQAERDLAELNAPELDFSLESVKASISLVSGVPEEDMDEWPILRFLRQREALQRVLGYLLCGAAEAQGAKWKDGNPYPSPLFDRIRESSGGVISLESFAGGGGMRAYQNAGNRTT